MTTKQRLALFAALTLASAAAAAPTAGRLGTVLATENADIYTYVQLEFDGEKVWYAVPSVELAVGDQVAAPAGMAIKNFHSQTLDRDFEVVYFAAGFNTTPAAAPKTGALPAGHPPIDGSAALSYDFSKIARPEGAKTVAEIHANPASLAGKQVIARGVAVKVTNHIMGKNWIHLRDGTGDAASNDLTVTTTNAVELGATITATGVLATNLDFGHGYQYAILLQDASTKD